jgi:uridine phosphorylase
VISELAQLGARTLLRVGTCGSLTPQLGVGELLIVSEAICEDGTSRALVCADRASRADAPRVAPAPQLLARLIAAAGADARQAVTVSTDLFYDRPAGARAHWAALGAVAVELETATVLTLARRRGLSAGSLLLVAEAIAADGARRLIDPDELRAGEQRLGEIAVRALSA